MFRTFLTLLLMLCASAVFAVAVPDLGSTAVSSGTDMSVSYLSQIFGVVGTVLPGGSGNMFGALMSAFNKGVMVIAAVILGYNTVFIILRFTTEGTLMAPNKNSFLIMFRIAAGFSLLIPMNSGYNVLQTTMMAIVKSSVSFADTVWEGALTRVQDTGLGVWHIPDTQMAQNPADRKKTGFGSLTEGFIAKNLSSAYAHLNNDQIKNTPDKPSTLNELAKDGTGDSFAEKMFQLMVCVKSYSTQEQGRLLPTLTTSADKLNFPSSKASPAGCGTVDISAIASAIYTTKPSSHYQTVGAQMLAAASMYAQPAKAYVCSELKFNKALAGQYNCPQDGTKTQSEKIPQWQTSTANAMLATFGKLKALAQIKTYKTPSSGSRTSFTEDAMKKGWALAGSFYWALSRVQDSYIAGQSLSTDFSRDISTGEYSPNAVVISDPDDVTGAASASGVLAAIGLGKSAQASSQGSTGTSGSARDVNNALNGTGLIFSLLTPIFSVFFSLFRIFLMFGTSIMGSDPILWLQQLGQRCMDFSAELWFSGMMANFIVLLPLQVCKAIFDASAPTESYLAWFKIVIVTSCAMFLGIGVLLGFMVPLYPFMVYSFAVIGWMIVVVEALIAMPLVALGITHPEGHDILGKAEQALMLILGVFLRPALMVIGLIASMILSYVVLRFFILTYTTFLTDLFNPFPGSSGSVHGNVWQAVSLAAAHSGMTSNSVFGLLLKFFITIPLLLFIFAGLMYQAIIACYSLIFSLPDYILRWIGGPQQPSAINPSEMAQQMLSQGQGFGKQFGEMSGQAGANYMKFRKKKDKEVNIEGKGKGK